jgi:hypothetical protein
MGGFVCSFWCYRIWLTKLEESLEEKQLVCPEHPRFTKTRDERNNESCFLLGMPKSVKRRPLRNFTYEAG